MYQTNQQKDLLVYHHKPKLTFDAVQIILANAHMNEQCCTAEHLTFRRKSGQLSTFKAKLR